VDGCRSAKHLEAHHIVPRAEGGTHDPSLLALLCDLCRARHKSHYADSRIMPTPRPFPTVMPIGYAA
jgi:HNH endonuclease